MWKYSWSSQIHFGWFTYPTANFWNKCNPDFLYDTRLAFTCWDGAFYFLNFAIASPIPLPAFRASIILSSISFLSRQISTTWSTSLGGTTTTPSWSATIRSPGLIHKSPLNCSATSSSLARVKVFEPRIDVPLAKTYVWSVNQHSSLRGDEQSHTGKPISCISNTSLNLPSMTTPAAPRYFARVPMSPPKQAEYLSLGCWMYITLPGWLLSAKCLLDFGLDVSFASTIYNGMQIRREFKRACFAIIVPWLW